MQIAKSSQLGLRFENQNVKVDFLRLMKSFITKRLSSFNDAIQFLDSITGKLENGFITEEEAKKCYAEYESEYRIPCNENDEEQAKLINKITELVAKDRTAELQTMIGEEGSKFFFICESVYKAAELIKISEGFTSRTMKDIKLGKYTYLMGKNRMVRFVCVVGAIKGFYYSDSEKNAFEFGLDLETGQWYSPKDWVTIYVLMEAVKIPLNEG